MSTVNRVKQGLLFFQVVALALLISSCSKEEIPTYGVGTGSVSGSYWDFGLSLGRVVNENRAINGFQLENISSSGSISNINSLVGGEIKFGIAQADDQYEAVMGSGEWRDKGPQKDLRAVLSMYTELVTLVAGGDSSIRSIDDLKGGVVDIGSSGSGTRRNAIDALGAAGIDWVNDIQAREENLDDRLTKFMQGDLDAFFFTVRHPNKEIKFATVSVRGARIIPLVNIDNLISANPYFSRALISAELYPMAGNKVDIETIGVNATLLTAVNVSEDVVYAVTKAIFENLGSLTDFQGDDLLEGLTAPIHPGALKYYQEIGLHIP